MRARRRIAFALVGATIFGALVAVVPDLAPYSPEEIAYAQTKRSKKKKPKPAPAATSSEFDASAPLSSRAEEGPPPGSREKEKKDAGGQGAVIEQTTTKGGDGGTRVFRFGEIDIEGRLRSPQLVYFLRRVRAEFAAGDLGHRSFMRELSDTRHDPNF